MPAFPALQRALWLFSIAAYVILLALIVFSGLHRRYRAFTAYIALEFCRSFLLFWIPPRTNLYAQIWLTSEIMVLIMYVVVLFELCGLVFRDYPGISSAGRWSMAVVLALALAGATLSLLPDLSSPAEKFPMLAYFHTAQRGVVFAGALFLLAEAVFLSWFPVPLSRNVLIHFSVFAGYFLSKTVLLAARSFTAQAAMQAINLGVLAVSNLCLLAWILLLSRRGEERTVTTGAAVRPGDEARLISQLAAINQSLLRAGRR